VLLYTAKLLSLLKELKYNISITMCHEKKKLILDYKVITYL